VKSEEGRGSRFYFTLALPRAARRESSPPLEGRGVMAQLGLRVLIVDDNAMNRRIIIEQMKKLGCESWSVEGGEQALERLKESPVPDAVLMDCHMPGMDGWETTRRLRAWANDPEASPRQRAASRLRVIALTAAVMTEERRHCREAGMNDFIAKPARITDLQRVLGPLTAARDAAGDGEG